MLVTITAQEYTVEKVYGDVQAMIGTSEEWIILKGGQKLRGTDLIATGERSFIQFSSNGNKFVLQGNSALALNAIRKLSLNELLFAFAMEEIRNVPKRNGNQSTRNTAVYGKELSINSAKLFPIRYLGFKKINGAKQLAQSGFKESAIIVSKETYRKYPETKTKIDDRLYFIDLMMQLDLFNEAISELNSIKSLQPVDNDLKAIDARLKLINDKMLTK